MKGWINHPFKPRRELPSSPDVFASSTSRQDCCIALQIPIIVLVSKTVSSKEVLLMHKLTTYPLSLFRFEWEEDTKWDVGTLSGFRFPWPNVFGSLNHEVKGEFGWCGEQNKQNTHLPLAAAARNHQYRSLGGGGRCLQLEERGPAEELHLRHIKTSRGEFRLGYDANQTDYSPSPPCCSSLRSISTGERKSGESPAVLEGQISRGTADAIPSNITR